MAARQGNSAVYNAVYAITVPLDALRVIETMTDLEGKDVAALAQACADLLDVRLHELVDLLAAEGYRL